ncbi:MAG: dipeptidase [Abditibacteriota bacterium]|nr:dipeptidase [Abditibacteriota bacterium]
MNLTHPYAGLEPVEVWKHFAALNAIARPSGAEEAARDYVRRIAEAHGATWQSDARGNIVVRVPATAPDQSTLVALQSHLDMVCEKRPDVEHDFACDAIQPRREGDWIFGSGTTLGADNGIGCALMLATLTTPDLSHGPLELLFTVEEETGLYGAHELDSKLISAPMLLNLDSEDPDELIIGCAGGRTATIRVPLITEAIPSQDAHDDSAWVAHRIAVSGLKGGHSGVQIHEPLGNAIKVLSGVLQHLQERGCEFRLVEICGGRAHNAIPRDAVAHIVLPAEQQELFEAAVSFAGAATIALWVEDEPDLQIEASPTALPAQVFVQQTQGRVLSLMDEVPHGVLMMSEQFEGKVQTSCNLASIENGDESIEMQISCRSFVESELTRVQQELTAKARKLDVEIELRDGYPGWEPAAQSQLREVARAAFVQVNGREPVVQVIHAGLECGLITAKRPGMEAISFGPLIRGAHTPEEGVCIPTVANSWNLLCELLGRLK